MCRAGSFFIPWYHAKMQVKHWHYMYQMCTEQLTIFGEEFFAYQNSAATLELSKSNGDVQKHDHIADKDDDDVCVALAIQLILNSTLRWKTDCEISVGALHDIFFHVFQEGLFPGHCFGEFAFVLVVVYHKSNDHGRSILIGSASKAT